ncbi:MAG: 2-oxoglutarate dehydrogenase complex dihydrolipoyllysine-residue succinyltransferase [Geminicoccaceae bacterium]|nr:2-oxoglutarate dehydrogenase complex dihydrolipoyllysine-residue succinyltransferase [Geminicoccaceae bacterium]MCX8101166.1 2-oxoglutarate dehydrogenase complex dihydrolipoyllysine-residue succinyltransferase [Geminicoccaceae bacterium]MDW8370501.1 2-oxoglutarate dehydrogenase complex dihydrolipoyllysine-residue succinyltransferase [Geminicoccaceae bacterium]
MSIDIKVPTLGESVSEATIARWLKQPGESVAADEPLVELETDKVNLEVPAPAAGVLEAILVEAGKDVGVGTVIGRIAEGAVARAAPSEPAPAPGGAAAGAATEVRAGPAARKEAAEAGVALAAVVASGPKGTITREDVRAAAAAAAIHGAGAEPALKPVAPEMPAPTPVAPARAPAPPVPGRPVQPREERVRMTRLRKRIAERLKEAQNTAAMLTTFNEVDMSAVMALRERYQDAFTKKHGVKLGFMSFFVKASIEALKAFPAVNAEIDGEEIVYKHYYDIGVAVSTDQGLVVPVVRDADQLSMAEIEKRIADLGKRAREGRLAIEELQGGTFTITNGGIFGSLLSTPILNPPQVGILGMHKIQKRPMVMDDGAIEARPMMYLALSYDHRIIDGREAVSFLVRVKECIEAPERMLLEA